MQIQVGRSFRDEPSIEIIVDIHCSCRRKSDAAAVRGRGDLAPFALITGYDDYSRHS